MFTTLYSAINEPHDEKLCVSPACVDWNNKGVD